MTSWRQTTHTGGFRAATAPGGSAASGRAWWPSSWGESRSGRPVIVAGTSGAAARAAVAAHHGRVTQDLWIIGGVAADVPAGEVDALSAEPGVTQVSDDAAVHVDEATPSPLHAATAVYPRVIGADRLWSEGIDGDGVTTSRRRCSTPPPHSSAPGRPASARHRWATTNWA